MKSSYRTLLSVLINPMRWAKLWPHICLYLINVFKYRNFSTNINSLAYWNKKLSLFGGEWRVHPYRHVLDLLPKEMAFSLLDIGCGLGDGPIFLQQSFPQAEISGLEFSNIGIDIARRKSDIIHWHHLDILKDEIPDTYDYILIIRTLEHFDDPFSIVKKCLKAARISLIINVPYDEGKNGRLFGVTEHRYFFDKNTFGNFNCKHINIVDSGKSIIYDIGV